MRRRKVSGGGVQPSPDKSLADAVPVVKQRTSSRPMPTLASMCTPPLSASSTTPLAGMGALAAAQESSLKALQDELAQAEKRASVAEAKAASLQTEVKQLKEMLSRESERASAAVTEATAAHTRAEVAEAKLSEVVKMSGDNCKACKAKDDLLQMVQEMNKSLVEMSKSIGESKK